MSGFKDIQGFIGYKINNKGEVYFPARQWVAGRGGVIKKESKITKGYRDSYGYMFGYFTSNESRRKIYIHRLVALAFLPNKYNLPEVNHKNGIKDDNRIDNLEWVSHRDNIIHAHKTGLASTVAAVKATSIRVKDTQSGQIFSSAERASIYYGFSRRHLLNMLHGKYRNNTNLIKL